MKKRGQPPGRWPLEVVAAAIQSRSFAPPLDRVDAAPYRQGMAMVERGKPRGALRWFLRAPIALYRARMGWLLGHRFLLLTHTGRKSGAPRHTVVEVVDRDPASGTYFIASGWGEKSDWLQNITKTPRVTVDVGARRFEAEARRLSPDGAMRALIAYAARHPRAFSWLAKAMLGKRLPPTAEACGELAARVPLVALSPVGSNGAGRSATPA